MTPTTPKPSRRTLKLADFFVSYCNADSKTANQFGEWLRQAGKSVHMLVPGEGGGKSFLPAMEDGVSKCDRMIAVYTVHYKNSKACRSEMEGMWHRDPDGSLGRIIFARMDPTEIPALFASRDYWDFTKIPVENVKDEFLHKIKNLKPVRLSRKKAGSLPSTKTGANTDARTDAMTAGIITSGRNTTVNSAGRDLTVNNFSSPRKQKIILARRGDEISTAQCAKIKQKIDEWGAKLKELGDSKNPYGEVQSRFLKQFKIPRYDALDEERYEKALSYIRSQTNRIKSSDKTGGSRSARSSTIIKIKIAMRQNNRQDGEFYEDASKRLRLPPFQSLNEISDQDLTRIEQLAKRKR